MELADLVNAIEKSWSKDTTSDPDNWTESNKAWGQCAVTACVVNDYLGGEVVWAEASLPDGRKISHYFNKPSYTLEEIELDLTRKQFPEGTVIPAGIEKKKTFATTRDYVLSFEKTRQRYEILKNSVEFCLKK